jgi:hypothetical protein
MLLIIPIPAVEVHYAILEADLADEHSQRQAEIGELFACGVDC